MKKIIEIRNITKRFPGIVANDRISFAVYQGEILAIVGENGAGKSTLMNILYGLYQPDEGEILIRGIPTKIKSPSQAIQLGIGMVHQHFMLIPTMSVLENIILGAEPKKGILLDYKSAEEKVKKISRDYGLAVDPTAIIENLSVGMQQRVEILKTLYRGAEILILDEPTAVLTPQETKELFTIIRSLQKEGKSIIFITHKLNEVMEISDRIVVLRYGKVTGELKTSETNEREIARKMVGREVVLSIKKEKKEPGEIVLKIMNLRVLDDRGLPAVKDLNLEVKAGEIVGVAGVAGNGQTELIEAIAGLRPIQSGKIFLKGKDITLLHPRIRNEAGLAHIPEDRHKRGLVLNFTVKENFILMNYYTLAFANWFHLKDKAISNYANELIKKFDVRTPSPHTLVRSLSGGNQQKIIIGREISRNPQLLIAAQPTRGLDVGAIEFVHQNLLEQQKANKAILLLSMELEEIINLSDRIVVMYEGEIVGEFKRGEVKEEELGMYMTGSKRQGIIEKC